MLFLAGNKQTKIEVKKKIDFFFFFGFSHFSFFFGQWVDAINKELKSVKKTSFVIDF